MARQRAPKPRRSEASPAARPVKLTVRIDGTEARRLKAFAAHNGQTVAQVVTAAINRQLAGFYCAVREPQLHQADDDQADELARFAC
jgi:hypothetical protein